MMEQVADPAREQVNYVKNPFELLFRLVNSSSRRDVTQVEFSTELHRLAQGLKRRRSSPSDKRRTVGEKSGSKRVGYSPGQISQRLKVDYFRRSQNDSGEPGQVLTREDEYVLNALLRKVSRNEFTDIFQQRGAIEEKIAYRLPRETEDRQSVLERKLSNLRGIWQFLHISLTKADMERVKYGKEADFGRYMMREGVLIFFGFGSDRIKTLLLGRGRAWFGETCIPGSKIYTHLTIPRTNEHGYLALHDRDWLNAPLDAKGAPAILDGMRSGTVSDNSYSGNLPAVACRCALRKLHHASQQFLANDAVIDERAIEKYKELCRYEALADLLKMSRERADFLPPDHPGNFAAERDYELKLVVDKLTNSVGELHLPLMHFPLGEPADVSAEINSR